MLKILKPQRFLIKALKNERTVFHKFGYHVVTTTNRNMVDLTAEFFVCKAIESICAEHIYFPRVFVYIGFHKAPNGLCKTDFLTWVNFVEL